MSLPITINRHSKNIDDFNNVEYIFQLSLTFKNNQVKEFVKVEKKNYVTIFNFNELVDFDNIKSFNLIITKHFINTEFFFIHGNINNEKNIFKNNDIYIEFNKNKLNYTKCLCTLYTINTLRLFFTPPNY